MTLQIVKIMNVLILEKTLQLVLVQPDIMMMDLTQSVFLVMINVPLVLLPLVMVKPLLLVPVVLVVSTDTMLQLVNVLMVTMKILMVSVNLVNSHVKIVHLPLPVLTHVPEKTDVLKLTVTVVKVIIL